MEKKAVVAKSEYAELHSAVVALIEQGRRLAARSINAALTSTYWLIGQRLVEYEQKGTERAAYGAEVVKRLARELQQQFGRGFSKRNLEQMRQFYLQWPIAQTPSAQLNPALPGEKAQTLSAQLGTSWSAPIFPLSWSHYVRLLTVADSAARRYYETEAIRGGWSVRQLDRQIATLAYQRHAKPPKPESAAGPESELKDPFVLEFLGLKDEYSESELEEALIRELEQFLLELGNDFAFIARQRRLRIGTEWYRVDLLFFHRRLRCLIVVDLKLGKFTHADAGQMNLYVNYAQEHWTNPDENPPIGLILCSEHDAAVAHYALGKIGNQVLARRYQLTLPTEQELASRLEARRRELDR